MVWIGLLVIGLPLLVGAYFLFRDSMNLFQKVGRVYWVTRNNMERKQPVLSRAFLAHDSPPYWVGKGIQLAIPLRKKLALDAEGHLWHRPRQWTFQVGILTGQASRFNPNLYFKDSRLRDWRRPKRGTS